MDVSIIICTYNRADHLKSTLDSIKQIHVPPELATELIVVDNRSTDHTPETVRDMVVPNIAVRYVYEATPGQTSARNAGMREAQGDFFLWTDDDVRLPENWIGDMCGPIIDKNSVGVGGKIRMATHLERPWMTRTHYDRLADTRFMPADFGSMIGANMAFHRSVLKDVPLFDTDLGPGGLGFEDDTLFALRMKQSGHDVIALPHVTVEHHFDEARLLRRSWLKNGEMNGRSQAYMYHHWHHRTINHALAKLLLWKFALHAFRLRHKPASDDDEGCDRREIRIVQNISFFEQTLVERKRKPKYTRT